MLFIKTGEETADRNGLWQLQTTDKNGRQKQNDCGARTTVAVRWKIKKSGGASLLPTLCAPRSHAIRRVLHPANTATTTDNDYTATTAADAKPITVFQRSSFSYNSHIYCIYIYIWRWQCVLSGFFLLSHSTVPISFSYFILHTFKYNWRHTNSSALSLTPSWVNLNYFIFS